MAIGMVISVLVEVLFPGGVTVQGKGGGGNGKPENMKEWLRNKLKALAKLLGRLDMKAAKALSGIIEATIIWILNRAKGVMGWVSQNLWALVICVRGLLYAYMVTRKQCIFHSRNDIQFSKYHKAPPIPIMLKVINANCL